MSETITRGYSFGSTELVTNSKLHNLVEDSIISQLSADVLTSLGSMAESAGQIPANNLDLDDLVSCDGLMVYCNNEPVYKI